MPKITSLTSLLFIALGFAIIFHIAIGAKYIPIMDVLQAIISPNDQNFDHIIIRDIRLPRAIIAGFTGAALAVAGAVMQGITRNPLADPALLGLLSGASFAVIIFIGYLGMGNAFSIPIIAMLGSFSAACLVALIAYSTPGGSTPITFILAGSAVTAFLTAMIAIISLLDQQSFESLRIWMSGSLSGRTYSELIYTLPFLIMGGGTAFFLSKQINLLALGDDVALGLGVNVTKIKIISIGSVIALTAASVALAGPLGFVGLVIPHIVRIFVGANYARIIPLSALTGAVYLILVDIFARTIIAPREISAGLITALIGAPLFIWIIKAKL